MTFLNFNRIGRIALVVTLVFSANAVWANHFIVSYFSYTKEQESSADKRNGAILFVIPNTEAEKIEYFANGTKIAEKIPVKDVTRFKKSLGEERFNAYKEQLQLKTDEEFVAAIFSGAEIVQLASVYDDDLSELMGIRHVDYGKTYKSGDSIAYSAKIYDKGSVKEERKATIKWGEPPKVGEPSQVKTKGYDKSAYVTWQASKEEGVVGYNIYLAEKEGGPYKKLNSQVITVFNSTGQKTLSAQELKNLPEQLRPKADEGNYAIKDLVNEKKYYVQVRSQHFNRMESAPTKSEEVIPMLGDTPPPVQVNPVPKNESIPIAKLTWQKVEYEKLAYFNIYRATAMSGPYEKINQIAVPKEVLEYTDRGPFDYAKTYWYRISAVSTLGNQGPSSAAVYFQPIKRIEPKPVIITKLEPKAGAMVVHYNKIDDKDLFKYYIMRANSSAGPFVKVGEVLPTAASYEDKELDARALYCYQVKAIDKVGNMSPDVRPQCENPLNGKALDPPQGVNVYEDQGGVVVAWSYPKHGLLVGFVLYRSDNNANNFKKISPQVLPDNERMFIDKDVKEGSTYYYYMQTVAQNNVTGLPSATEKIILAHSKPQPVQNLRVHRMADNSRIVISWEHIGEADLFIVEAEETTTKKKITLTQTKSKTFQWLRANYPKNGRYEITVRARKNNIDSRVSDRNRISFD